MAVIIKGTTAKPSKLATGANLVTITFQGKSDSPNVKIDFAVLESIDYKASLDPDLKSFTFTQTYETYTHNMNITAAGRRNRGLVKLSATEVNTGLVATDNGIIR